MENTRFVQRKGNKFFEQKSYRFLGRHFWISIYDRSTMRSWIIYHVISQILFSFVWVGLFKLLGSELYPGWFDMLKNPGYLIGAVSWGVIYISYGCKKFINKEYLDLDNLMESSKKTIFGKIRVVYYSDIKTLRRQKLEKLKSLY